MESSSPQLINVSEICLGHEKSKKLADADANEERSPCWADLPGDVLNSIFSRLFNFDCIRFRLTCKAWRFANKKSIPLMPPPPSCSMIQLEHSSRCFPWLMFFPKPKISGIIDFFHPVTNETYTMHIPELANSTFRCSRYGWLLMSRGTHSFFFYNPFTPNSTINLPDFHQYNGSHPNFISMSFTAPPTSPDCIVFAHIYSSYTFNSEYTCIISTCGRGEDSWSTKCYSNDWKTFRAFHCPPTVFKDIPTDQPNYIVSDNNIYTAKVDGEVISVFVDPIEGYPVHVFKLDWSKMKWVTVKSLGNKTMFISETTGSLLVPVAEATYQNRIYFSMFRNKKGDQHQPTKDKACVFYSLETRKYHASGCDFSSKGSNEMEALQNSLWIEPNVNNNRDGVEDNWFKSDE